MKSNTLLARCFALGSAVAVTGAVLGLAVTCASRAYASVVVPNQLRTTLTVPPGGASPALTLPVNNQPLTLSASCVNFGYRGTAFVHLTHVVDAQNGNELTWTGVSAPVGAGSATAVGGDLRSSSVFPKEIINVSNGAIRLESFSGAALNQLRFRSSADFATVVAVEEIW
jgi:hypothetical protein